MNEGPVIAGSLTIPSVNRQLRQAAPQDPLPPLEAQIRRAIVSIAESDCPVLIVGEHGAGKRSIAAQIHARSHRSRSSFIEFRSADVDAQALLSVFSAKGTVYLAEIGDLSTTIQNLIIDTFFRSELTPGSRLLCGTSRELLEDVKSWRMREDFLCLVSSVTLRVLPLRFRKSEILSIANDLLTQYSKQFDRPKPDLREETIGFLMEYGWPGNLRELQTAMKTLVVIGDQSISVAALKASAATVRSDGDHKHVSLKEATRAASIQIERQLISEVLVTTGGNRKRAAVELGISYKALLYKLKKIGTGDRSGPNKIGVS